MVYALSIAWVKARAGCAYSTQRLTNSPGRHGLRALRLSLIHDRDTVLATAHQTRSRSHYMQA
jgi:hypothetical protein